MEKARYICNSSILDCMLALAAADANPQDSDNPSPHMIRTNENL
jgi:hypothetical protein